LIRDKNMAKKIPKRKEHEAPQVNENCSCLIDEFIVQNSPDKERLCSIQEADFEVFTDPDAKKVSNKFYIKNQTDGLPIIPPTRSRVDKFLKYSDLKPEEIQVVFELDDDPLGDPVLVHLDVRRRILNLDSLATDRAELPLLEPVDIGEGPAPRAADDQEHRQFVITASTV